MATPTKYKYSQINEMKSDGDYNFYGIIYDASFPLQEEAPNSYICYLKIIDPTINCLTNPYDINEEIIHLIIKSNCKENLPFLHTIGDIIRVHRGVFRKKNKKNIYLNLTNISKIKSSWILFPGFDADDDKPIGCSSSNYTFEKSDYDHLHSLRDWIKNYFPKKNSIFYQKESKLTDRIVDNREYDFLLQVVHKEELSDKMVYYVQDETDGCELHTYKYFDFFEINDIIRIRSVKMLDPISLNIVMNKFSNILKIPPFSHCSLNLMQSLLNKMKSLDESKNLIKSYGDYRNNSKIIIQTISNNSDYPEKSVNQIRKDDKYAILTLNVAEYLPNNILDFSQLYCKTCKDNRLTREYPQEELVDRKFFCRNTNDHLTELKLYYNFTLICRENPYSNRLIKIYCSSYDNEGYDFLGIPISDFSKNSDEFEKLKIQLEKLTSANNYIKVLTEVISIPNQDDFILRIIGKYNQVN